MINPVKVFSWSRRTMKTLELSWGDDYNKKPFSSELSASFKKSTAQSVI